MEKWFRVVKENGTVWIDGVKKRNFTRTEIVPDNSTGFIVIGNNNARFISDEDMTKVHVPLGKDSTQN